MESCCYSSSSQVPVAITTCRNVPDKRLGGLEAGHWLMRVRFPEQTYRVPYLLLEADQDQGFYTSIVSYETCGSSGYDWQYHACPPQWFIGKWQVHFVEDTVILRQRQLCSRLLPAHRSSEILLAIKIAIKLPVSVSASSVRLSCYYL